MNAETASNPPRRVSALPDRAWRAACEQYEGGRVLPLELRDPDFGMVTVHVTQGWLDAWYDTSLTGSERAAIRAACIQIASGHLHPCLGATPLRAEPVGAWIACPAAGINVTWRTHWSTGNPVLLTLTRG